MADASFKNESGAIRTAWESKGAAMRYYTKKIMLYLLLAASVLLSVTAATAHAAVDSAEQAENSAAKITDPEIEEERRIGRKAVDKIEEQWPLIAAPAVTARLQMVMERLEPHMERRLPYELRVVSTDVMNAFCLPGGYIFFTTGIIDALNTDSEVAAVMAHEMIHADRKHSIRMAAESNKVSLAALAIMILSGGSAAPIILAQVAQTAITNEYTKELEAEADRFGLDALIAAGYSPSGMVTLFEKFMDEELKNPIRDYGIYMDHPKSERRRESALNTLRERKIPVERKNSLGLLRTDLKREKKRLELTVDGQPVWGGKRSDAVKKAIEEVRGIIDAHLQLETPPYDVRIMNGALYIGNRKVTGAVKGMDSVESFREKLVKAMDAARRKHPSAKWY